MWKYLGNGEREFLSGKNDRQGAALTAEQCDAFKEDVEEEIVADEIRSCYNCRNRRWTANSFTCMYSRL